MLNIKSFKQNNIAIFFMLLHCIFMPISTILLKVVQHNYHIAQIVLCYNLLICISLGLLSSVSTQSMYKISLKKIREHFFRSIFGFIGFLLFFYSISNMPVTESRAILAIDPILTALFATFFLKESISKQKLIAFIITFIGAMILLHPKNIELSIPALAAFLAAFSFAIFNNITKKIANSKTIETMFYLSLFSSIYTLLPAIYHWKSLSDIADISLICCITLSFGLGSFTVFNAFKRADLSLLMPIHFLGIVTTAIFSFLIFSEITNYLTILGAFIIVIGTIPLFYKKAE